MHPADIKAALEKKGYKLTDVARLCNVSHSAVCNTIHNRPFPSPKVQAKIAEVIGRDESEIWPAARKTVAA